MYTVYSVQYPMMANLKLFRGKRVYIKHTRTVHSLHGSRIKYRITTHRIFLNKTPLHIFLGIILTGMKALKKMLSHEIFNFFLLQKSSPLKKVMLFVAFLLSYSDTKFKW